MTFAWLPNGTDALVPAPRAEPEDWFQGTWITQKQTLGGGGGGGRGWEVGGGLSFPIDKTGVRGLDEVSSHFPSLSGGLHTTPI